MLIALASLLRYGQMMNQQQEMRMHAFRRALNKAYGDYSAGGFGGASYTSLKHMHTVSLFSDHYDGSQRSGISGGATVLWDPDLMYAGSGDRPNSYVEVDGIERNLRSARREEIVSDSTIYVRGVERSYQADGFGSTNNIRAYTEEHLVTRIKMKAAENEHGESAIAAATTKHGESAIAAATALSSEELPDVLIVQDNTFVKDESWITPWK